MTTQAHDHIPEQIIENVVIIGWWPAWLTAAIYAWRALLNPIVYEWFMAAWVPAWCQLMTTTHIENWPWFAEPVMASDLMGAMRQQAINSWARIETRTIDKVDLSSRPFKVHIKNTIILAKTVIVATWASAKYLWCEGEKAYRQRWISACAVCDWALPMFRNKPIVIVWGWDTAAEEAHYMTKYWSIVYLCVRRDQMRASKAMQERVLNHPQIKVMRNTEVTEALWNEKILTHVRIKNNKTWEESELEAWGMFYAIGHTPATWFLDASNAVLEKDENGYIITKEKSTHTSIHWLFACWDVQDHHYRQAITSAWSGCKAAMDAEALLSHEEW